MQEKPRSKTPTWIWFAIGSLVAGGTAAAIENQQNPNKRNEGGIIVNVPAP